MNDIKTNYNLMSLNTLGVSSKAQWCVEVFNEQQLIEGVKYALKERLDWRILGGGSNVILPESLAGLTILMRNKGIIELESKDGAQWVDVEAGETWHDFVVLAAKSGWHGLENLSFIPGTVGACPIQNIGAYGVEAGDFIEEVFFFDTKIKQPGSIKNKDCKFAYRDSIFKQDSSKIITKVRFKLAKQFKPNLEYAPLDKLKGKNISPVELVEIVKNVRNEKLPDPSAVPNAGSFFKNPVITQEHLSDLLTKHAVLPNFAVEGGFKVPAAWLIDHLGFKGHQEESGVGCYYKQPLVIVNYKHAAKTDILNFAEKVQTAVSAIFGINLEIEPVRLK